MAKELNTIQYAGQVSYEQIIISNYNGAKLNITDLVQEINIYEDLFSNILSGSIAIVDATSMIDVLPIIGQESIKISLAVPGAGIKTFTFSVYSVSNIEATNNNTAVYVLNIISNEAIIDRIQGFSKVYSGESSKIVSTIISDWLPTNKKLLFESGRNIIKFISPYWSPFEAINYVAARTTHKNTGNPSFFFYETLEGFNFRSIETLFESAPLATLVYRDSNIALAEKKNNLAQQGLTIEDYEVLSSFDFLESLNSGILGTEIYSKDVSRNEYTINRYNYLKSYSSSKHLNKFSPIPNTGRGLNYRNISNKKYIKYTHNEMFTGYGDVLYPNLIFGPRSSLIEQLNTVRLNITLPGSIIINPGKIVDLQFPVNRVKDKVSKSELDTSLSGRYIVSSVRHNILSNKHSISAEVLKESLIKELI